MYEFASPFQTTYPLWYDPYYWHEGVRTHADVRRFMRVSRENLAIYVRFLFFEHYVPVLCVLLFLAALQWDRLSVPQALLTHWPVLLVALCALGMFAMILVEPRYVVGLFLLAWAPLFLATGAFALKTARVAAAAAFVLAIMLLPTFRGGVIDERKLNAQQNNLNIATEVQRAGIYSGEKIAYIGNPMQAFWAKLDRVRIVADAPGYYWDADGENVPVPTPFWQSSKSQQAAIYDALTKTGAQAVLAVKPSNSDSVPSGWQQVGDTDLWIRFLHIISYDRARDSGLHRPRAVTPHGDVASGRASSDGLR